MLKNNGDSPSVRKRRKEGKKGSAKAPYTQLADAALDNLTRAWYIPRTLGWTRFHPYYRSEPQEGCD
ncbi:MAG: hypothetical protein ACXVIG_04905 [Halobacteriota archaeon]